MVDRTPKFGEADYEMARNFVPDFDNLPVAEQTSFLDAAHEANNSSGGQILAKNVLSTSEKIFGQRSVANER